MFYKFIYYVAGIDRQLMEKCPRTDRILAVQLGVSLLLTFSIVSGIMYFSLNYIDGNSISYDVDTKTFSLSENNFSGLKTTIFVVIALIVGAVVFLFDRILFMSDWFYHTPFGVPEKFGGPLLQNALAKLFRITVRLIISIAMAYALSTFLELKIFESKILEQMQTSHVENNQGYYDQLNEEVTAKKQELASARLRLSELNSALIALEAGQQPDDISIPILSEYDAKIEQIRQSSLEEERLIRATFRNDVDPILEERARLSGVLGALQTDYSRAVGCARVEQTGSNPRNLTCDATNGAGRGARFHEWEALGNELATRIASTEAELRNIEEQRVDAERRRDIELQTVRESAEKTIHSVEEQKALVSRREEASYQDRLARRKTDLETLPGRIAEQKAFISELEDDYAPSIERMKASIFSPTSGFKPFRDGPLDRMVALATLRADPFYGNKVTEFSWWIKGFLIFLEVVPVLSKMFFSPPTGYSQLVQNKLRHHSTQASAGVESLASMVDLEKNITELSSQLRQEKMARQTADDALNDVLAEIRAAKPKPTRPKKAPPK